MDEPSLQDREAIHTYWRFYEPRNMAVLSRITAEVAKRPHLQPLLAALVPSTPTGTRAIDVWPTEYAAIEGGDWPALYARWHALGVLCANADLASATWFELVQLFRDAFEHELGLHYAAHPDELALVAAVSRGLSLFLMLITRLLMDGYIAGKTEHLRQSQARYHNLFEHSPQPMWTFDPETLAFLDVNEAAIRQYGYSRDEFLAMTLRDIRPPEDVPRLLEAIAHDVDRVVDARHRMKNGTLIDVEVKASTVEEAGRPVRLAVAHNVTATRQARESLQQVEEQLRHAQKMEALGRLAGGVAHDFNNVLTVIESYASMLEESLGDDIRRADATEIRRASERATAITSRLLAMSRRSKAAPRAVDVDEVVEGFTATMRQLLTSRVSLVVHRGKVPLVSMDPNHLEQVLMNLVVNARDAMPEGGRVTIESHAIEVDTEAAALRGLTPGRYVEMAVTDTGTGMDAQTRRKIFDPFFTTKDTRGTGLGLSIVHGIVTQAHGAITVHSEPGRGTTFRVYLPVTDGTPVASEPPRLDAVRTLPPIQILVVDDQPELLAVAARILQDAGCRVVEANSGERARRIAVGHESAIDVALVDVALGDTRGDQLARQLQELRPAMKVVLMSGYAGGALDETGAALPDVLAKPFTPAQLRGAIAAVLDPTTEPTSAVTAAHKIRVLVAEDDEPLRRLLARVLQRNNFEVVAVENGVCAIAELETRTFDVVLSDVQMPGGTGLDLLRAVRRIDLDVPVVLMTGQPDVASASAAVEYGAFRYLTKPVDNHELVKLTQTAARAHALARMRRQAFSLSGAPAGAVDRAGLEVRFDQALDSMWMAFQPVVNARSGVLFGVEALLRTAEPTLADPQAFVAAAAQLDRLPRLGRRVRELCAIAHRGRRESLFVNLHPDDLLDMDLCALEAPLTAIAHQVILEVTERAALGTSPELAVRVARLRELGFRIAVDDIGAGYSGLTSFTELAPEVVKIDMSLVRDVHVSALKQRTIRALTTLCHEAYALVVAEGVETGDERDCLIELGCDLLQGYYIGRPTRELPPA